MGSQYNKTIPKINSQDLLPKEFIQPYLDELGNIIQPIVLTHKLIIGDGETKQWMLGEKAQVIYVQYSNVITSSILRKEEYSVNGQYFNLSAPLPDTDELEVIYFSGTGNVIQGLQGPRGIQGIAGPQGERGETGFSEITPRGSWNSTTNYSINDMVNEPNSGNAYIAIQSSINSQPTINNPNWALVVFAGAPGPQGNPGIDGEQGEQGIRGEKGEKGEKGDPGIAADISLYLKTTDANSKFLPFSGGQMSGSLKLNADATIDTEPVTLRQMKNEISSSSVSPKDLLKGFISTYSPPFPSVGDYWYNSSVPEGILPDTNFPWTVKQYQSGNWVDVAPVTPDFMDIWVDIISIDPPIAKSFQYDGFKWDIIEFDNALFDENKFYTNADSKLSIKPNSIVDADIAINAEIQQSKISGLPQNLNNIFSTLEKSMFNKDSGYMYFSSFDLNNWTTTGIYTVDQNSIASYINTPPNPDWPAIIVFGIEDRILQIAIQQNNKPIYIRTMNSNYGWTVWQRWLLEDEIFIRHQSTVTDCNLIKDTGLYPLDGNALNSFSSSIGQSSIGEVILVLPWGIPANGTGAQIAISTSSNIGFRILMANSWGPWVQISNAFDAQAIRNTLDPSTNDLNDITINGIYRCGPSTLNTAREQFWPGTNPNGEIVFSTVWDINTRAQLAYTNANTICYRTYSYGWRPWQQLFTTNMPPSALNWIEPNIINGSKFFGVDISCVKYAKLSNGMVQVNGYITAGTANNAFFFLPSGMRPGKPIFSATNEGGVVTINWDGSVTADIGDRDLFIDSTFYPEQ